MRNLNTYTHTFTALCPVNNDPIDYTLTIEHDAQIMAESIVDACRIPRGFHETIADELRQALPGRQTLIATHRGVHITTTRGE